MPQFNEDCAWLWMRAYYTLIFLIDILHYTLIKIQLEYNGKKPFQNHIKPPFLSLFHNNAIQAVNYFD